MERNILSTDSTTVLSVGFRNSQGESLHVLLMEENEAVQELVVVGGEQRPSSHLDIEVEVVVRPVGCRPPTRRLGEKIDSYGPMRS